MKFFVMGRRSSHGQDVFNSYNPHRGIPQSKFEMFESILLLVFLRLFTMLLTCSGTMDEEKEKGDNMHK